MIFKTKVRLHSENGNDSFLDRNSVQEYLSKSTGGKQPVKDFPNFTCISVYVCICVTPPGQMKNDTDLKFGTHTPIDFI